MGVPSVAGRLRAVKESFLLDPGVVFLNHGVVRGVSAARASRAYQAWQREIERHPVELLALERRLPALLDDARRTLAGYVGAAPDNLAFTPNTTNGAELRRPVARARPGRRGPARRRRVRRHGAPLGVRPPPHGRHARCGGRSPSSTRGRARASSSAPTSSGRPDASTTSHRSSPARAQAGALLVVDGAHAPGQVELDLESLGADVYAGNCHKWLCAPKGSAFLYARPEAHDLIDPAVVSWDWLDGAAFHERHRWQGTRDPSAYLAVPAAIAFQAEHDWPRVRGAVPRAPRLPRAAARAAHRRRTSRCAASASTTPIRQASSERLYDEHRIEVPVFETPAGVGDAGLRAGVQRRGRPRSTRPGRRAHSTSGGRRWKRPAVADNAYRTAAEFRAELRRFLRRSEDSSRRFGITPRQHLLLLQVAGAPDATTTVSDLVELVVAHPERGDGARAAGRGRAGSSSASRRRRTAASCISRSRRSARRSSRQCTRRSGPKRAQLRRVIDALDE